MAARMRNIFSAQHWQLLKAVPRLQYKPTAVFSSRIVHRRKIPNHQSAAMSSKTKRSRNTAQKTLKFALVRWLADETVGVMPLSATKEDVHVGSVVNMKWNRTLYEAEILKISGQS